MNKLKEYRKLKKLTQQELAQILEINSDYISMIERGIRTPGFKLANRMASLFNISIDELNFLPTKRNKHRCKTIVINRSQRTEYSR